MTTYTINHQKYYQNNKPEIMKKHSTYLRERRKQDPLYKKYETLIVYKSRTKNSIKKANEINHITKRDKLLDKLKNIDSQLLEIKTQLEEKRKK